MELEEPFNAGEMIVNWNFIFPNYDETLTFFGFRSDIKTEEREIVCTHACDFSEKRNCHMLREDSCKGFSGSIVANKIGDDIVASGLLIARWKNKPNRSWVLPANKIREALINSGYRLNDYNEDRNNPPFIDKKLQNYIKWLNTLRGKNNTDKHFIDIECSVINDSISYQPISVQEYLTNSLKSISGSNAKKLCILGDYGTGKTCIAIEFCYTQTLKYFEGNGNVLPLYIPLRNWDQLPTKKKILDYIFANDRYPINNYKELHALSEKKVLFFVLDGIDELTKKLDPISAPEIIQKIPGRLPDGNSFAILGRISYFIKESSLLECFELSKNEVPEFLVQELEAENYQAIKLIPLSKKKIESCVFVRCGDNTKFVLDLIKHSYGHEDLSSRPVLLNMIIECSESFQKSLTGSTDNLLVTTATLYNYYINKWLTLEGHRCKLSRSEKLNILEALALHLVENGNWGITYKELVSLFFNNSHGLT